MANALTLVVARFIEHLTTIPSDKSADYNSILPDKSADYHDTQSVVAQFPVVARFIEHHHDESGIYNEIHRTSNRHPLR